MSEQLQPIAEFADYDGLRDALRAARERRGISFETMDEIAGSADGYWSKVLAPGGSRRVTMDSLTLGFGAVAVKCLVIEDEEQLRRIQARLKPRNEKLVRRRRRKAERR